MSEQTPDIEALFAQARALQEQMLTAQAEVVQQQVIGQSAGGKISITANGGGDFQSVHIDPELIDDIDMLEDLLLAALRDVSTKVAQLNQSTIGDIFGS